MNVYVTNRSGHYRRYAIDACKLEHELGWKPTETFETGIRKTVQWYLDNPELVANLQCEVFQEMTTTACRQKVIQPTRTVLGPPIGPCKSGTFGRNF